jgi:hypothetical protein
MNTLGLLTAAALGLVGFVCGVRHAYEPRGLYLALFSGLLLFSVGREWIKRL